MRHSARLFATTGICRRLNPHGLLLAGLLLTAKPFASPAEAPAATLTIADVTIVPMDKEGLEEHQTVTIRDSRIVSIVPTSGQAPPNVGETVDGRGKYLIPGLVDAHAHVVPLRATLEDGDSRLARLKPELQPAHAYDSRVLFAYLQEGVTTVFHLGGGGSDVLELRDLIQRGQIVGPRLVVGKLIDGPTEAVVENLHKAPPPSTPEHPQTAADGRAAVAAAIRDHYDFIKSYQHLNAQTYDAIEEAAHAAHLITMGHLPEIGCATCVSREHPFVVAMDDVAHAEELGRYAMQKDLEPAELDRLTRWMLQAHSALTPTLILTRAIRHMYLYREVPPLPAELLDHIDPVTLYKWQPGHTRYLSAAFRAQPGLDLYPAGFDFDRVLTRQLFKKGVPLLVGTDAQTVPGIAYGYSVHQEMLELLALGLTPYEVLRAATVNPHALLRESDRAGFVREGQRADLVLLNSNPLVDIRNTRDIAGVIAAGHWLSASAMRAQSEENRAYFVRVEKLIGMPDLPSTYDNVRNTRASQ